MGCGESPIEDATPRRHLPSQLADAAAPRAEGVILGHYSTSTDAATYDPYDTGAPDVGFGAGPAPAPPSPPTPPPAGGGCTPSDPSTLTACCDDGEAYCRPVGSVPPELVDRLASCGGGEVCVPAEYLGGGYDPAPCASLGGAEGACVSLCVAEVQKLAGLLPQATCADGERCAPCIDPTNGEPSGACDPILCEEPDPPASPPSGGGGGGGGGGVGPPSCDNPPAEPMLDPNIFPACCPGAHCVPNALIPGDMQGMLSTCDADNLCVPDTFIAYGGLKVPDKCTSVAGMEGRCTSTCIPQIAEQADLLPTDICGAGEVCAPCCDPFTGQASGACDSPCDVGPAAGFCEVVFTPCCSDIEGHCVPSSEVPSAQQGNLEPCDNGLLCVPDVMQDLSFKGGPCYGSILFMGDYFGVCLPKCLKLPMEFMLDTSGCAPGWVCAPCKDPFFGASTGAPGCP